MAFFAASAHMDDLPIANRLFAELCEERGARLYLDGDFRYAGYIERADGKRFPFVGAAYSLNGHGPAQLAKDKDYTGHMLAHAGLPTPTGIMVHSDVEIAAIARRNPARAHTLKTTADALTFATHHGYPVFVKPNDEMQGTGVSAAHCDAELNVALKELLTTYGKALVQQAVKGKDLRIIVLDGNVLLAVERIPLNVTGDGETPLGALIEAHLSSRKTRGGGQIIAADDPRIHAHLKAQGRHLGDVPALGEVVGLVPGANLSTGGSAVDRTSCLAPDLAALAVKAAEAIGLRYAGVDLMAHSEEEAGQPAHVLEVNAAPGLTHFYRADQSHQEPVKKVYGALLDAILASN
ncbi:ATP-binding protein [Pseudovibrio flavus]|uniref:ATP-binding protein n=1 Tax=Pseudovibrio flavus TaxID=2529854 RepID=UPI00211BC981|nr:cyanophycin synthetase [Pseudovibrio flavus]